MDKRKKPFRLLCLSLIYINIISFVFIEACYVKVQASSFFMETKSSKVVLILTDNIELQDYTKDIYFTELMNHSNLAFISGRQTGKASANKAKLMIGAGKRLEIPTTLLNAVKVKNKIELSQDNKFKYESESILLECINSIKKQNENNAYKSYIGYLGEVLNTYGRKTCLLGNSDTSIYNRSSALILMDNSGLVDTGDADNTVCYDNSFPGGKRTDYSKLMGLYNRYSRDADLIVIDTGDISRLEYYQSTTPQAYYEATRHLTIQRISAFIKEAIDSSEAKTTFIIMSAYPSKSDVKDGFKLTPIAVYNNGASGLLYSESTKRTGIITSSDIADYIIQALVPAHKSNLKVVQGSSPFNKQLSLKRRLLNISQMRLPVLYWYAVFEILSAIAGFIYITIINRTAQKLGDKLIKLTLLANIIAPAVLLFVPAIFFKSTVSYFCLFIILSFLISYLFYGSIKNCIGKFIGAAMFVNFSIAIDLLGNSIFIKSSVLGYDPIIGARFYGIGNEFAGVFIGSGILLAGCIFQSIYKHIENHKKLCLTALLIYILLQIYLIGAPVIGANFGATIAALVGYFFFYCSAVNIKISIKQLLLLVLLLLAVVCLIIILDLMDSSGTTHVGKLIVDIKANGINVLFSIIARKAAMNLKLIKYTIWTKVLLCIILIITIMFFKPVRLLHRIFKENKYLAASWLGISAASIAGLLVNDSGIVMAATAMIFTGYTILFMCLQKIENTK